MVFVLSAQLTLFIALNNNNNNNNRKMAINKINCALITTAKMKKVKFHNVFL